MDRGAVAKKYSELLYTNAETYLLDSSIILSVANVRQNVRAQLLRLSSELRDFRYIETVLVILAWWGCVV